MLIMKSYYSVFDPVRYVPASEKDQMRALRIESILAVAHEPLEIGGNHWCFYLQTENSDRTESICIDTVPSHTEPSTVIQGGSKSYMIISKKASPIHQNSENADTSNGTCFTKICPLPVSKETTVGEVIDLLIKEGRQKYEFSPKGTGCRKWVADQIWLLSSHNFNKNEKDVLSAVGAVQRKYPGGREYPMDEGAYYE